MEIQKNIDKYSSRLLSEWIAHKKLIISVDFDDTLKKFGTIDNQEDIDRTIKLVKEAYEVGAYIVIFTASDPSRHDEIYQYCKTMEIPVNCINKNPIELPYGKEGKIYYNINLCDRSGLCQALDILESAMYYYKGYLENLKKLNEIG